MNITRTFVLMISGRMMFGGVIGFVVYAFIPKNIELLLGLSIAKPVITHIPRLGPFLVYVVVYKTGSGRVVRLQWCGRLGML